MWGEERTLEPKLKPVRRLRNRRSSQRLYRMRYGKCVGSSVDLLLPSRAGHNKQTP